MPLDATHKMCHCYYKIGTHGLVFIWLDNAWFRSTKLPGELDGHETDTGDMK